ncbi:MAG: hypothetical protein ABSF61_04500 [Anaerolineales bacterium]
MTLEDWRVICKHAIGQARRGNASARSWLSHYVLGPAELLLAEGPEGESVGWGRIQLREITVRLPESVVTAREAAERERAAQADRLPVEQVDLEKGKSDEGEHVESERERLERMQKSREKGILQPQEGQGPAFDGQDAIERLGRWQR